MRILLGTSAGLLLCTPLFFLGGRGGGGAIETPPHHSHDPGHDSGGTEVCATGCAALPALDRDLSADEFERLLAAYAVQPMSGESAALEALLFHGAAAGALLDTLGGELDAEREAFLRRELTRTHARLDVRITDETGVVRLHLGDTLIPLGEKQHLHPHDTNNLQTPEVSGTVHRVGLKHLWARL